MISLFLSFRYIIVLASVGVLAGAFLMFWEGMLILRNAFLYVRTDPDMSVIAAVLNSTDKFLFGIVLMIFAYAITFGFVIDLSPEMRKKVPAWMILNTVAELKSLFFQVIILYLVVHFATVMAETEGMPDWNGLVLPAAILLLAGAMKLVDSSSHDHTNGEHRE
ncbi:YqhA family protein [Rhizobium paranaense]|uniref:Putative membrane protein YqhA n=1 Tax=Rhizobium paranaense TaxID=1650438 RepID=A0A7W9D3D1_9HYPH|nr:YqhA family protein [Rhizobium paranaense]MBB5575796.1 putative membrane protein YqhA [Rhizobium paranaense]